MIFRHKFEKRRRVYFLIAVSALIALFLGTARFDYFPPNFIKRSLFYFSGPLFSLKNMIAGSLVLDWNSTFKEKQIIERENFELKQSLKELEMKEILFEGLLRENQELKNVFSRSRDQSLILASVISRPGYGPYGYIIIDAGLKTGIREGALVTAYNYVFLGHVVEAASDFSKVKLISYPDEETNVFIEDSTTAIAVGRGGLSLEVVLPHDIEVEIGGVITTLGTRPLLAGLVEKITREPTDPFQRILFNLPVNIQNLKNVYVVKD